MICIFFLRVYDTPLAKPLIPMANQRKKGVSRVTLTIPDELLERAEAEAEQLGTDRLAIIREAIANYLAQKPKVKTRPTKGGDKG